MPRSRRSRTFASPRRGTRLHIEALEPRHLLSVTSLGGPAAASLGTYSASPVANLAAEPVPAILAPDVNVPQDFSGTPLTSTSVQLTWTADGSAIGYDLFEFENGQPVLINSFDGSTGTAVVTGLAPSTQYAFNLVAFDISSSGATPWIGVSTLTPLAPPANFVGARLSDSQIQLTWTDSPGAFGYNLYEFENGQAVLIATYDPSVNSATVSNLLPNTTYAFNLVAFDSASSAATTWIAATTSATLSPPANFSGTAPSTSQVQLTWTGSVGATGYSLYEFENGQAVLIATYGPATTSATINGLAADTTYAFNLVAFNATKSAATAWIGVTTAATLLPPASFSGSPLSANQVSLQWSTVAGATGYSLYEFEAGAPALINTFDAGTTSTTVVGLSPSTTYAFNLVAFNSTSTSATPWIGVSTTS